tara:strand:- start:99 stop:302 length:204 start_codon:yes stop_codon:yes gene_type:complete
MNVDIEILRNEIHKTSSLNSKLQDQLRIAVEGLKALSSGGEQTGIANKTLEEIEKLDLPQEGLEAKE